MTRFGLLGPADRLVLATAADAVLGVPLPGCRELHQSLACLAAGAPTGAGVAAAGVAARRARVALLSEASPDRWLGELDGLGGARAADLVADMVATRRAQADQVASAAAVLDRLQARVGSLPVG